jgi:hypothetical protein
VFEFLVLQGLKARVLYQMPSTAISWSVYEGFKHVINTHNITAAAADHPYDTLASDRRSGGGGGGGSSGGFSGGGSIDGGGKSADGGGGNRLWEAFTDIPRAGGRQQLHASESWSSSGGSSSGGGLTLQEKRTCFTPAAAAAASPLVGGGIVRTD